MSLSDRLPIVKACDIVMDMGMGYVTLGQPTSSFSGGEAQRLKLLGLMHEASVEKPSILIFDEPTTGLSDSDVGNLLAQLRSLTAKGHTIIVVEHHLDVLRSADWLIEIGPEAADQGGDLVYQGPPSGVSAVKRSVTAPFL
jgi:excinuclease ABC subunit A